MAIYKYACSVCGEVSTFSHPMNEENPIQPYCKSCHSMEIIRIWEVVPVHYKGTGFYSTDEGWKREYKE